MASTGPRMGSRIAVGMSGGVDSSVTAYLLKQQGYDVVGLFMKNWDSAEEMHGKGQCTAVADRQDAEKVCRQLKIPLHEVDFTKAYWNSVFERFLDFYDNGLTPNPDLLCNREVKFKLFKEYAKQFGAEYLATGHYCRTRTSCQEDGTIVSELLQGVDPSKDQSYFLASIEGGSLQNVLFPVGHLLKKEVRVIAQEAGLYTAKKRDSYGICFVGERDIVSFLSQYIDLRPGYFMSLDGTKLGEHLGVQTYTTGQRARIGGVSSKYYVTGRDFKHNIVYVVPSRTSFVIL
eukprot:GILJ01007257.1.p1 GENE.GILJ01007257.1~~GILJ01007257.1.p1  ORF type:complete len:327 (+),score=23.80 GILJ01007257.1:117-983(+)